MQKSILLNLNSETIEQLDEIKNTINANSRSEVIRRLIAKEIEKMRTTKTINIKFNANDLPQWAQRIKSVVDLCESDLSFRVNVYSAKHSDYINSLIKQAEIRTRHAEQD